MEDWRDLIDLGALARWMDGRDLGSGEIADVVQLGGGTQNILLRFTRAEREYILRRPPAHPRPASNETMRREARVLSALEGTGVPHPGLVAAEADRGPLGTAFYLMEPIDGVNVADRPLPVHQQPATQHRMGLAMAEAAARLGEVDPFTVGLEGFGRTDYYLERQPGRWRKQLDGYAAFDGWPGPDALPGVARIGDWLAAHTPGSFRPGIIHGDYHIGNVMFRSDGGELAAIVDWELSTIGDPLIDLGWMIATWSGLGDGGDGIPPIVAVEPWLGFPSGDELVAAYAATSTRNVAEIDWYVVLACYKLGIILEGTHARACAGLAERETGDSLHTSTLRLFERALGRID